MHRKRLAALLILPLLLTGCSSTQTQIMEQEASVTLPPVSQPYTAPVGDASLNYTAQAELFLPSLSGDQLVAQQVELTLNHGQHPAETVLRALFNFESNRRVQALGGDVRLQLAGVNPVEISCGVATVTLASSALQLSSPAFYTVCQGIAATLAPYGVSRVNVLVSGQTVAMDLTASLPLGTVTAAREVPLSTLWKQLDLRKPALNADVSQAGLNANVTLFFPVADGTGILAETRDVSFDGQTPAQLAQGLIDALSAGPQELTAAAPMPDVSALLSQPPDVSVGTESNGRTVTLRFAEGLDARLKEVGVDQVSFLASLTYTLTTFIPYLTQVTCVVGGETLTRAFTAENRLLTFPAGDLRRSDFAAYVMDVATLYLVRDARLTRVERSMPYYAARNPRALLLQLLDGPTATESAAGLQSLLPHYLGDADILGFSVAGDTLLINLSATFITGSSGLAPAEERLMAYSIINTLCDATGCRRVRFYFGSAAWDTLCGGVWWNGDFMRNTALVE